MNLVHCNCSFAGGTDVFGRSPSCRACHALIHNLHVALVPRLQDQMKRDARRRSSGAPQARRTDFGAYESAAFHARLVIHSASETTVHAGLIQDELSRGCFFTSTYHDKVRVDGDCCSTPCNASETLCACHATALHRMSVRHA